MQPKARALLEDNLRPNLVMSVEDKKIERSKAKMGVTVASRRLIGAVNREREYDILKNLMIDLEKAYDDFCNVNEEFEIIVCEKKYAEHRLVNGEDIKTYKNSVYNTYQDARKLYVYAKRENEENVLEKREKRISCFEE